MFSYGNHKRFIFKRDRDLMRLEYAVMESREKAEAHTTGQIEQPACHTSRK